MASEHEHVFDDRWRCAICNEQARRVLYQREQQLAQTRKENERWERRDAEWTESNAKAVTLYAEARALLEEVSADDSPGVAFERDGQMHCYHCGGEWVGPHFEYQHNPDCTWVKIRAFLAQHTEQANGK